MDDTLAHDELRAVVTDIETGYVLVHDGSCWWIAARQNTVVPR